MCILFIYRNPEASNDSYRLIVASNRDETFERPALPAHYWQKHPECLGGTDMEPGKEDGTWLALSIKGKAGVVLNLPNEVVPSETPRKGRGALIINYITSNDTADSYLNKLHKENQNGQPYNPYNLVLLELYNANVYYLNNSTKSTGPQICEDNILGFGNSYKECPYKKVEVGREKFKDILHNAQVSMQDDLIENLLKFLKLEKKHLPDPELQRRVPTAYEHLSSLFIPFGRYCTRTHSILLVNGSNQLTFVEETLMPDQTWKRQIYNAKLICKYKNKYEIRQHSRLIL